MGTIGDEEGWIYAKALDVTEANDPDKTKGWISANAVEIHRDSEHIALKNRQIAEDARIKGMSDTRSCIDHVLQSLTEAPRPTRPCPSFPEVIHPVQRGGDLKLITFGLSNCDPELSYFCATQDGARLIRIPSNNLHEALRRQGENLSLIHI